MKSLLPSKRAHLRAFSLIEILVVVGIITILLVLAAPTLSTAFKGSKLVQGSEAVRNFLAAARQTALKNNVSVEVRFYKFDDPDTPESTESITAYRMYQVQLDYTANDPLTANLKYVEPTNLVKLPSGVVLSPDEDQSTLLGTSVKTGQERVKGIDPANDEMNVTFVAFQFRPDGSLNLPVDRKWFMTLMNREEFIRDTSDTPSNYVCLQMNPYNGEVRWLQPN
jgi:uncharacterized protein (TIGR02596 family)